ncbi:MAG: phosphopantetheine-protein transferase [marine bacterium B5-7]|nr:MAG: phosphopantetheine-protein transferase [marine bacterium B5-7]
METVWQKAPENLNLSDDALHVWHLPMQLDPEFVVANWALLNEHELARAKRFYFEKDRQKYALAHGGMRCVLARYLDCHPKEMTFTFNEHNKPGLQDQQVQFNLSHTDDVAVLAVTRSCLVGVDIEKIDDKRANLDIAKRFFSTREYEQLRGLPDDKFARGFFNVWTRKEAFVKAIGLGLSYSLDQFSVSLEDDNAKLTELMKMPEALDEWHMGCFSPAEGVLGAWACLGDIKHVEYFC